MKPRGSSARSFRGSSSAPAQLPMAWMDPMSWRLPSGKALAEFALQSGFLAPLLLGGPSTKRKKIPIPVRSLAVDKRILEKPVEERPETASSFRETR